MKKILFFVLPMIVLLAACTPDNTNNNVTPNNNNNNNNNNTVTYHLKVKIDGVLWEANTACTTMVVFDSTVWMGAHGPYNGLTQELEFDIDQHYSGVGSYAFDNITFHFQPFMNTGAHPMYFNVDDSSDFINITYDDGVTMKGTFKTMLVSDDGATDTLHMTDGEFVLKYD